MLLQSLQVAEPTGVIADSPSGLSGPRVILYVFAPITERMTGVCSPFATFFLFSYDTAELHHVERALSALARLESERMFSFAYLLACSAYLPQLIPIKNQYMVQHEWTAHDTSDWASTNHTFSGPEMVGSLSGFIGQMCSGRGSRSGRTIHWSLRAGYRESWWSLTVQYFSLPSTYGKL